MRRLAVAVAIVVSLTAAAGATSLPADAEMGSQLAAVRNRIQKLEGRLKGLDVQAADASSRERRFTAETELAGARVEELELVLGASRSEILRLRADARTLAGEMQKRIGTIYRQLQMMALLGRPGPLQLLFDAAQGGDLGRAVGTITVLTGGQLRLLEEYGKLEDRHRRRLTELNLALDRAQTEAAQLEARRRELEQVRERVARERRRLERERTSTKRRLDDLRQRESALERLLGVLASHRRMTGREDIRSYRGALPWPARGVIVETFGRHRLPQYATYTVCNGLRMKTAQGSRVTAIFPGVVAFARYFKGYGNMVVIDHGHGVYSLVAGLATILVRRDQNVAMGTRLGLTPPAGSGGNLYIEVRVDGKAMDPRRWLRLMEGTS